MAKTAGEAERKQAVLGPRKEKKTKKEKKKKKPGIQR